MRYKRLLESQDIFHPQESGRLVEKESFCTEFSIALTDPAQEKKRILALSMIASVDFA